MEKEIPSAPPLDLIALPAYHDINSELKQLIESLGKMTNYEAKITNVILRLCLHKPMKSN